MLLAALPAWSQVEPSAIGPPQFDDPMEAPPAATGEMYPSLAGLGERANELRVSLSYQTAYDDNVLGLESAAPVSDETYSIMPMIAYDRMTPRLHETFEYDPDFTLYQHTGARNEADENASAGMQFRLTPHTTISARDLFSKSSNVLNSGYLNGSAPPPLVPVVAPFADEVSNSATGQLSYQFTPNGMVGAGGVWAIFNYLDPAEAAGLSNSSDRGGSAFYNYRVSRSQYLGVTYRYAKMVANSVEFKSEALTNTIYAFYSLDLAHSFSISVSGGPQHFDVHQPPLPSSSSWTPAVSASVGWEGNRISAEGSYSRTVTGAAGLLGVFLSNSVSAFGHWQFGRTWTANLIGNYALTKNVTPLFPMSNPGGHSASGTASVRHPIGERYAVEGGYSRIHQIYSDVPVLSAFPDSDRVYITLSYELKRPVGR